MEFSTGPKARRGIWRARPILDSYGNQPDYGYTDFAISATETHIFSPTALNEFRGAWVVH